MYVRKEVIEEEKLDWGEDLEKIDQPETESEIKETKHIIHPAAEKKKIIFKKPFKITQENLKRRISELFAEYSELSLLLILLAAPYMIGFVIVAFILIYGGVPIHQFFSAKEGIFHFELWSIGSYVFITGGVIWLVMMLFLHRR